MTHPTKLTPRLDSGLIKSAKAFALGHERSLSQLVADYFARIADPPPPVASSKGASLSAKRSAELSPFTTSLRGVLKTKSVPKTSVKAKTRPNAKSRLGTDPDKAAYRQRLEEKYL